MANEKIIKLWLDALRSGEYKQGQSYLRLGSEGGDKFCCLGVLCDISDPSHWQEGGIDGSYVYDVEGDHSVALLPESVREHAGISRDLEYQLIGMNDEGAPFNEIADYIERKVGG